MLRKKYKEQLSIITFLIYISVFHIFCICYSNIKQQHCDIPATMHTAVFLGYNIMCLTGSICVLISENK